MSSVFYDVEGGLFTAKPAVHVVPSSSVVGSAAFEPSDEAPSGDPPPEGAVKIAMAVGAVSEAGVAFGLELGAIWILGAAAVGALTGYVAVHTIWYWNTQVDHYGGDSDCMAPPCTV